MVVVIIYSPTVLHDRALLFSIYIKRANIEAGRWLGFVSLLIGTLATLMQLMLY